MFKKFSILSLLLSVSAFAQTFPSNTIRFGDGAASNKQIIFNKGGSNPQFRFLNASSVFQISVDGSTFRSIFGLSNSIVSGGLLYASSSSEISSSNAVTNHGVIMGGGAGGAPTSSTAGTALQVFTSNGASTNGSYQDVQFPASVAFSATDTTTSITNGSTTTIVNPTEDFDTNNAYDNTTGIFTAPSTGVYVFSANFVNNTPISQTASNAIFLNFNKNNGGAVWAVRVIMQATATYRASGWATSPPIQLTAGDTMRLTITNTTGSTITGVGNSPSDGKCFFGGFKIGN